MKTTVLKASHKDSASSATAVLQDGGVIVYPTDTCYGLGADATNDRAVKKVIEIKKRSKTKKISIAFSELRMARKYLVITKDTEKLAEKFMPGPLTLIVGSRTENNKVGFRIPDDDFSRKLIRKLGSPITATSANISGNREIYKIKEILETFGGVVDMIIDGGALKKTKPSTVYDVVERKILRKGPITEKQINAVLM